MAGAQIGWWNRSRHVFIWLHKPPVIFGNKFFCTDDACIHKIPGSNSEPICPADFIILYPFLLNFVSVDHSCQPLARMIQRTSFIDIPAITFYFLILSLFSSLSTRFSVAWRLLSLLDCWITDHKISFIAVHARLPKGHTFSGIEIKNKWK